LVAAETVTVTAAQVVVDPTRTTQQTNFNQEHLKYGVVGSANRSYQNVLFQAPEANVGSGGGSNPMVSGANVAQNTYLLDGVNTIPSFGAPPGATTLAFNKNAQPTMNSQPQLTFGGPIMRDRLWFFTALSRPRTAATPANLFGFQPGARTFTGWNNMGKLTFT